MKTKPSMMKFIIIVNILFLIVMENFTLDLGMGYFGYSFLFVSLFYTIFMGDMNQNLSKMINTRTSRGLTGSNVKILRITLLYHTVLSLFLLFMTILFSKAIMQALFHTNYAVKTLQFVAIAFFLNGYIEILTAYFKGNNNDSLYRLSQILKLVLPIVTAPFIIKYCREYGEKVARLLKSEDVEQAYISLGIAGSYALSMGLILLIILIITIRNQDLFRDENSIRVMDSTQSILNSFIMAAFHNILTRVPEILSVFIAVSFYMIQSFKYLENSNQIFINGGLLFAKIYLPICLILIIFSEYVEREQNKLRIDFHNSDKKTACIRCQYMIKNAFFILLPPSLILTFLADPLVKVFYTGQYQLSSQLLHQSGFLLIITGFAYLLNQILNAIAKEYISTIIKTLAFIIQMIFLSLMIPKSNGQVSVLISSFYINLILQIAIAAPILYRFIRMNLMDLAIKFIKCICAGIVSVMIFIILDRFIMMNVILMILSMILGYFVYYISLIALRGISKKDLHSLRKTLNYYPVQFLSSRLHL